MDIFSIWFTTVTNLSGLEIIFKNLLMEIGSSLIFLILFTVFIYSFKHRSHKYAYKDALF